MPVYGAALEFLAVRFKGLLREVLTLVTVGVTGVLAVARNSERVSLTFVNLGNTEMWLDPTPRVSSTRGIRLGPNGGLFSTNVDQDGILPTLEYYAVSTAAAQTLYVIEVNREVRV